MNLLREWRPAFDVFAEAVVLYVLLRLNVPGASVSVRERVRVKKSTRSCRIFRVAAARTLRWKVNCGVEEVQEQASSEKEIRNEFLCYVFSIVVEVYVECVRIGSLMTGAAMGKLMNRNSPFAFVNSVRHVVDE